MTPLIVRLRELIWQLVPIQVLPKALPAPHQRLLGSPGRCWILFSHQPHHRSPSQLESRSWERGGSPFVRRGRGDVRVPGGRGGSEWQSQPLVLAERFPKHPSMVEVPAFVLVPAVSCCGAGCSVPVAAVPRCWQRLSVLLSSKSSPRRGSPRAGAWTKLVEGKVSLPGRILSPCLPLISIQLPREVQAAADIGAGAVSYVNAACASAVP